MAKWEGCALTSFVMDTAMVVALRPSLPRSNVESTSPQKYTQHAGCRHTSPHRALPSGLVLETVMASARPMKYTSEPTTEATCDLQFTRRGGGLCQRAPMARSEITAPVEFEAPLLSLSRSLSPLGQALSSLVHQLLSRVKRRTLRAAVHTGARTG
jgi:hypothetical protein